MPVCPYCVTLNVINNQSESNDIREYNCNVCIRNSNISASVTVINASNNYVSPTMSLPVESVNILADVGAATVAAAAAQVTAIVVPV